MAFYVEYGYLVRHIESGEIDTDTQYPRSKEYADETELVDGFEWVKVKLSYEVCDGESKV